MSLVAGPGLRVGLRLPQYASSWPDLRDAAIRAESLGFDSAWLNDHLWTPGRLHGDDALDAFTGLAAVAAVTDRITLGTAVLSASYRPAPLAAKMASVLDVISGGRLVLGIGTGSDAAEHRAYGYPFPPARARTEGLVEALDVLEAMWRSPDGASVAGSIDEAPCNPPPITLPRPPVLVAAHRPGLLRIAGARADGLFAAFLTPEDLRERVAIARNARLEAGGPDDLRVAVYLYALPMRDEDEALGWIAPEARALGSSPRSLLKWLGTRGLVAPPAAIAAALARYADAGATDAVLVLPNRVPPEVSDALAEVRTVNPDEGGAEHPAPSGETGRAASARHNLVDLLVEQHRRAGRGGDPAVSDHDGTWDYDALSLAMRRAAAALRAAGLRAGQHVAVVMRDGRPWVQAVLGVAAAGGVAIPLDPDTNPEALEDVLADAAVAMVVADDTVPGGSWRVVGSDVLNAGRAAGIAPVHPEDLAYIIYSSGSTGRPKGAMHAHRDMRTSAEGYAERVLGLAPGDTCHAVSRGFTSLGFGNGFFRPLGRGAHVVHLPTRPTVRTATRACAAHGVTVLSGVPTFWSQLAAFLDRHPGERPTLRGLRLGVSSGDSLPGPVLERLAEVLPDLDVLEGFGCSEVSNIVLSTREGEHLPGCLGRPVPGAEVSLRDEDGAPVAPGTPGRLWIRSGSNTSGYWRRAELSRDLLHGEWVRMGDMLVEDNGVYRHVGRADDLFKVDAMFVSPVQVEAVVLEHPAVAEAAVVGRADARGLMRAVAVVVAHDGADREGADDQIRRSVAHALGPHCAPAEIEWRDGLPRLPSGKVARRALRDGTGPSSS
ncbi:MAG: LLM class flavin-dependent oxidoreductase [Thermoleophilia bacterium]